MATDWLMLRDEYLRTGVSLRALATLRGVGQKALARAAADGGWAAMRREARRDATDARPGSAAAGERRAGMAGAGQAARKTGAAASKQAGQKTDMAASGQSARKTGAGASGKPARKTRVVASELATLKTGAAASERGAQETGAGAAKQTARKTGAVASKQGASKPPPPPSAPDADTLARLRAISGQLTDQLARAAGQLDKQVLKHRRKTRELVYDGGDPRAKPVEETVEEHCELEIVDVPVSCEGLQRLSSALKNLSDIVKTGGGDEQSVGMVAALMKKLDDEAAKGDG